MKKRTEPLTEQQKAEFRFGINLLKSIGPNLLKGPPDAKLEFGMCIKEEPMEFPLFELIDKCEKNKKI